MYSDPWKINLPLSEYTTKILKMYLQFPENEPFTVLDWKADDGDFLQRLTKKEEENAFLYGVSSGAYNCTKMRESGFHRVSQADYRSEAKITNEAFSMTIVNPDIDDRIIHEIFETVDPYNMPNFEDEVRESVLRQEEEKQRLQRQIADQIDFGAINEDINGEVETKQTEETEETEETRHKRIQSKIKKELENRIKSWRMAMREQQKKIASMRWDKFLLNRATTYLKPGGILVMITPKELIDDTISFVLVNQYEDIKIIRLDEDEYHEYRKCIILAKKRNKATREEYELGRAIGRTKEKPYKSFGKIQEITANHEEDPDLYNKQDAQAKVDSLYEVLEPQTKPSYVVPVSDPEDISLFRVGPMTGDEALVLLKKSKLIDMYQEKYSQVSIYKDPVTPTPLHKGHIMLLLTSGVLNGYIGTGPDQHLVKGSAIKDSRAFTETDDDGNMRVVEREYYNIGVKLLNAQGEFRKIM